MTKKCVFQQQAVTFFSHLLNVTMVMQSVHCMINIDNFLTSVGKEDWCTAMGGGTGDINTPFRR